LFKADIAGSEGFVCARGRMRYNNWFLYISTVAENLTVD